VVWSLLLQAGSGGPTPISRAVAHAFPITPSALVAHYLAKIEISPSGFGVHFPDLDADLYLPGLLEGVFGSRKWLASQLGKTGGRSISAAKTAASRSNGKRGGRPKKKAHIPDAA
jgi:hypothetical protein